MKLKLKIRFVSICILGMLMVTACSKNEENNNVEQDEIQGTYIKINMIGVVEGDLSKMAVANNAGIDKIASLQRNMIGESMESMISVGSSLDAITSFSSVDIHSVYKYLVEANTAASQSESSTNKLGIGKQQILNKLASTTRPLDQNKAYKLFLFDEDQVITPPNTTFSSNQTAIVPVNPNKEYQWVVISTNEGSLPEISENGIISKNNLQNKNILYASGTIRTREGENPIPVILQHHRVRYDVLLDARGVFGTIKPSTKISLGKVKNGQFTSIIQRGDLDLRTGQYINVETLTDAVLGSQMTDTIQMDGSVKKYSFYTIYKEPVEENSLTLRFDKFDVEISSPTPENANNVATRSFAPNRLATFEHDSYVHNYNGYYDVHIKLVDAGLPVEGLIWARTNLIYEANKLNKYVFRSSNDFKGEAEKDYWNYRAETTGKNAKPSTNTQFDPCAQVHPLGVWRTPTLDDFKTLGKQKYTQATPGLLFGMQYIMSWQLDNGATIDNGYVENNRIDISNDRLRLTFGGFREEGTTSIRRAPWGFLLGALGAGQAHYWTKTPAKNNKAYYLYCDNVSVLWSQFSDAVTKTGNKDVGRFIRCVRGTKKTK